MASSKSRKRRKRRRSRPAPAAATPKPEPTPTVTRRRGADDPPPAPWGSFPLVEIAVLVGLVMLVIGFFFSEGQQGAVLIGIGLILGSLGGLELAIREHWAGYRSHTMILAGVPAAIVLGVLFYEGPEGLSAIARAAIGAGVFAVAALLLTRVFRDRSGGHTFKLAARRRN